MSSKSRFRSPTLSGGLLAMVWTANIAAATPALQGQWAGDRMQLVIDAQGGRVESDCASGHFGGPVLASADGKFDVQGSFDNHQPGAQRADGAAAPALARYRGELHEGVLKLTITPAASSTAQVYTLQSGARIKLLRCL